VNKKAILATVLVVQLVLIILISVSMVRSERVLFAHKNEFSRLAAYRVADSYDNIEYDLSYLEARNATNQTMNTYISYVYTVFPTYSFLDFEVNRSYIRLQDHSLEIIKEVYLK
jgi:hypothetical protein